jgi:hypothetical protein
MPGIVMSRRATSLPRCPDEQVVIDFAKPDVDVERLLRQRTDDLGSFHRYVWCFTIDDPSRHQQRPLEPLGDVDAKLGEQAADHVDQLCTLLDQQIARPVHRQRRLLLGRLHRHEPHRRPRHRFANRFRIGSVGLAALDIRLDVSRRHQAHLMAEFDQFACPVMRGAARLHADQARRQPGKEWQHLRSPKRPADNDLTGRINAVNLKNALGQIKADRGNLHDGWLPFCS